jgi:alpha-mannosidase/mannosylglycerate hydrolase
MVRSEELVEMEIDTVIRLRPGARHLDVETTIHNNAGDHRVRVLFPTAVQAETFLTDSAFDVVERDIALAEDNYQYNELDVEVRPMLTWAAISDKERGLAVVSTGQFEVAVRDQSECPLALTLFRSTRRTVLTDGEPEGQLLGPLHFRYRLIPFAGAADRVGLFRSAECLANGLRAVTLRRADQKLHATGASLPPRAGFLAVDGSAVLSSARMVGDALEVRLFNPNTKAGKATVSWPDKPKAAKAWKKAELVDLESKSVKDAKPALKAGTATVSLKPKQIVTLRLS